MPRLKKPQLKKIVRLNLSARIVVGLAAGVLCGLLFGEAVAWPGIVGKTYIGLLQMAILPYMVASLIGGIGALDAQKAKRLAVTAGVVLLASWGLALGFVFLTPLAFPSIEAGAFFSPSLTEVKPFDFVGPYIPVNPFRSMAQTVVPAVAVFSVATGIGLISVSPERKRGLLDMLEVTSAALTRVAVMVIRLAPFGLFAIAANAAGTMTIEEFGRLQVFIGSFVLMTLVLTFVVMPGIVAVVTPFRYTEVLRASRAALITGFATGNLFVVLPLLVEQGKLLFQDRGMRTADTDNFIEVLIPISFNFPNLGKLLTLAFVLFAGWYTGNDVALTDYPMFSVMGVLSLFGGVDLALPFLLDQMRIPSDMYQLYVVTGVVNGWFATLLAVMNLFSFTLIATCAATGTLTVSVRKAATTAVVVVVLLAASLPAARIGFARLIGENDIAQQTLTQMRVASDVAATVVTDPPAAEAESPATPGPRLERILADGVIRVGYHPKMTPFSFFNHEGELVGLDVALMHTLADELGVGLEFVPWTYETRGEQLSRGEIDIAIGGLLLNAKRLANGAFSLPYMTVTASVVVKDHRRAEFESWDDVAAARDLRLAILGRRVAETIRRRLPDAQLTVVESPLEFFEPSDDATAEPYDGLIMSAEGGYAHTILYPQYDVAIPAPQVRGQVAFALPRGDPEWSELLAAWIRLKQADQTIARLYDKWILGRGARETGPRWCVARDVLGWME
ncbi:Cyclohexadienyl dehydratase precursor [Posidoniimonas polymericola]|uniref:Cyclohexadienyl dehydratase n=1 Tax=Posidoniimonas polymericola TaxID=2528002 RepID=A0A5C5XRA9_9BACT|nr:cation:dicarboxylase symporter family transporter [Posidoniimonas polymericola]TWT65169.1 Cyclohexadienyl dehydratase precursor [Posidoniimonas polymericola]